ncbi:MAG: ABC transporter substrate-binding protein [Pseudomonadota bacterium]
MKTSLENKLSRRSFAAALLGLGVAPTLGVSMTQSAARQLVLSLVKDINRVIASGRSEAAIIQDFEKIFARYADVPTISRAALGPAARSAPASELSAFAGAFQGYMARKYGRRFREFQGGQIEVDSVEDRGRFFEVQARAVLRGQSPFQVAFRVSDRSGRDLFFDMLIEGISLLSSERVEIGALLDQAGGSIPRLTQTLRTTG